MASVSLVERWFSLGAVLLQLRLFIHRSREAYLRRIACGHQGTPVCMAASSSLAKEGQVHTMVGVICRALVQQWPRCGSHVSW